MRIGLAIISFFLAASEPNMGSPATPSSAPSSRKVYILPIREEIMPPLVYLVRRGVKEAMEAKADVLVLDMETNGGRVDTTEEIIKILDQFQGLTVTYVNRKAFSAGAFIAFATQKIYMAPLSVIGAAAPLIMMPGGGPMEIPETLEAKVTSGIRALVRARAEKNGYNVKVVEAMIDKTRELRMDEEILNEKGQILTLTNVQAEKEYGNPPTRLLSSGTAETLEDLMAKLHYEEAQRVYIQPTGVEKLATWINTISPLLLIVGVLGLYIEFKTPGFGLPGIVGLIAFVIYFFGGYVAGLSGIEWVAVFFIGLVLFILEIIVFPGTVLLGLGGAALMFVAIVMAMVDVYPTVPGLPAPMRFRVPLSDIALNLVVALFGSAVAIWLLSRLLPRTSLYAALVSCSVSGENSILVQERHRSQRLGETGVTVSALRPGGKAQFGHEIVDVMAQGEMISKNQRVKIIAYSGTTAVVEAAD
ncbi:MAG: hypothetical protein HY735_17520 [Verrucomicrobia bacterium]|nr:hypothetical protein [Verrucomicrobiota bacterium]